VHVCFSNPVPKPLIDLMDREKKFVNKMKAFYEVNLDFNVWQDNIFKVQSNTNKIVELINPGNNTLFIEQMAEQLFSLCSVMGERPYVQYQGDSEVSEKIAALVYKKLEYLYNYNKSQNSIVPFREPRGTLLVVDRTFDMVSPLLHDYHYQSMVYDYLEIPENGSLSQVLPP
jgi:syntaxin-binding protein 1